jgi:hypothetical protein
MKRAQHRPTFLAARRCIGASSLPLTLVGVVIFRHKIAYDVLLLVSVVLQDARGYRKWLSRSGVPTIDRATSAWRCSRRVRQHSLRCTAAHRCCLVGRAQMSDVVDPYWRVTHCRAWMSPPVRGGASVACAKVAYDVPVLAVVVWRDERRCRTMSTHRGAWCSVDHRCRRACTVAPPSRAPRLPTMNQYSLLSFDETSADVGRCRPVEARDSASTIDLADRAWWHRRCVRQHSI